MLIGREYKHILVFLVCFGVVWQFFIVPCDNCDVQHKVNMQAAAGLEQAQTGDVILVRSPEFFSRTITDLSGCDFSGIKMVYKAGDQTQLIISDTGALGDVSQGLVVEDAHAFFAGYNEVSFLIMRPLVKTKAHFSAIEKMVKRARLAQSGVVPVEYDLAFDNSSMEKMTCQKIVIAVYGDYIMDRGREQSWLYGSTFPCDLHFNHMQKIGEWVEYWQ